MPLNAYERRLLAQSEVLQRLRYGRDQMQSGHAADIAKYKIGPDRPWKQNPGDGDGAYLASYPSFFGTPFSMRAIGWWR